MVRVIEPDRSNPCQCTVRYSNKYESIGAIPTWRVVCDGFHPFVKRCATRQQAIRIAEWHEAKSLMLSRERDGWDSVVASASRIADTLLKETEREVD